MFLTLNEYLLGARKILAKHGYACLRNDEDAISYVASCMMNADHTWDGKSSSRTTWRFNQARYAILKLQTKHRKKRKHVSLDSPISTHGVKSVFLHDILEANDGSHVYTEFKDLMEHAEEVLTERQYDCLSLYYREHMTLQEIGDKLDLTRERVRQILKEAINKLRNECQYQINNFAP